jgi:hypothetical protein
VARYALQTAVRAAAVSLLTDYAASTSPPVRMQIYPARPRSVSPPTGFVDALREAVTHTGLNQRTVSADVIVVHAIFDSKDAADQKDAFVDGFVDWSLDHLGEAGANTVLTLVATEDIPDYVPEWLPPEQQRTYYATRISLEGLALEG